MKVLRAIFNDHNKVGRYLLLMPFLLFACMNHGEKTNEGSSTPKEKPEVLQPSNRWQTFEEALDINGHSDLVSHIDSLLIGVDIKAITSSQCPSFSSYLWHPHPTASFANYLVVYKLLNQEICVPNESLYPQNNHTQWVLSSLIEKLFLDSLKINLQTIQQGEVVYFPGDSILYHLTDGLEDIQYNPQLWTNDWFDIAIDANYLKTDIASYLLNKPLILDNDRVWHLSIDSVYKDFFEIDFEYEYEDRGVIHCLYNNKSKTYVEEKDIGDFFDIPLLTRLYRQEYDLQIRKIIENLDKEILREESEGIQDSSLYKTYIDAKAQFEALDFSGLSKVQYHFTDSTVLVLQGFYFGYPYLADAVRAEFRLEDVLKK